MEKTDWHDIDEFPEDEQECNFCGFVECACDEINDQHEIDVYEIEGEW